MTKSVSIFGGIGTKLAHYSHAVDVYKSNGYKVFFYGNRAIDIVRPSTYPSTTKTALSNDARGTVIHCNSGGLWLGLDYLANTNSNKLVICEAGPLSFEASLLIRYTEAALKFKCPDIIRRNRYAITDTLGIPHEHNEEWNVKYSLDLERVQNFVCMTSKNDHLIDDDNVERTLSKMRENGQNVIRYKFDTGSHINISKMETQKYQDIIQKHLTQIENPPK